MYNSPKGLFVIEFIRVKIAAYKLDTQMQSEWMDADEQNC